MGEACREKGEEVRSNVGGEGDLEDCAGEQREGRRGRQRGEARKTQHPSGQVFIPFEGATKPNPNHPPSSAKATTNLCGNAQTTQRPTLPDAGSWPTNSPLTAHCSPAKSADIHCNVITTNVLIKTRR